jgi:hypothetical protein
MIEIGRGTTPPITVKFNVPASTVDVLFLTITQQGETVIEKDIGDAEISGNNAVILLTQAETLTLEAGDAQMQIRWKIGNAADKSRVLGINVTDVLKEGVI